jgi:hypothetical protein
MKTVMAAIKTSSIFKKSKELFTRDRLPISAVAVLICQYNQGGSVG